MPFNLLKDAFDKVKEAFTQADPLKALSDKLKQIGNMASDLIKSLLRSILPTSDGNESWWKSITGIASAAIPQFIYDYAGIDKSGRIQPNTITGYEAGTAAFDPSNPFNAGGEATNFQKSLNNNQILCILEVLMFVNIMLRKYLDNMEITNINL